MLCNRICLKCAVVVGLMAAMTPDLLGEGGLVWFTDQAEFEASMFSQGMILMGIEDFEESILDPQSQVRFDDSLESGVPNLPDGFPFPNGMTGLPNLIVQSNMLGSNPIVPDPRGPESLLAVSSGYFGYVSDVVVASFEWPYSDSLDLIFTEEKRGIGFNPIPYNDAEVEIRVYSATNEFLGMMKTWADQAGTTFVGVSSQDPIGRININGWASEGTDNIQAWEPLLPSNDDCANALPIISLCDDTDFSTLHSTTDGPPLPKECDEGWGLSFESDIWYSYIPKGTGTLTVSTCSQADYDTRLAAYTGNCGALNIIACNDDNPPDCATFTSLMEVPVGAGIEVLIRVGGFNSQGRGTLTLSFEGSCSSDLDGSGAVGVSDLLILFANWGSCK